jgi:CDP-6-deoxy-D-xylo-4-hexulose-3-dehydrase
METWSDNIDIRTRSFAAQKAFFGDYEDWFTMPREIDDARTGWLAFPMIVRESAPFIRRDLQIFLEKRGVQTRTVFTGNILRQPGFKDIPRRELPGGYPNTDDVMRGGVLMACHHGLTTDDIAYVHDQFRDFAESY